MTLDVANYSADLMLLRRIEGVHPTTLVELAKDEGEQPYFPEYVDNDRPRDAELTDELMKHTLGFGVAKGDGQIIGKFKKLQQAEAARANAKITFDVNVDVDGEEHGEEE